MESVKFLGRSKKLKHPLFNFNYRLQLSPSDILMLAVVSVKIHLLDFLHHRITRVGAGALIVESLLGHFVETREEVFLIRDVIADRGLDADTGLKVSDGGDEVLELLGLVAAANAESRGDLEVALKTVGVAVLRERTHLARHRIGVEAEHFFHHERIGDTVRYVVECTELVGHRVHYAEERIGESHTGDRGGISHLLTGDGISALLNGCIVASGEIREDRLERTNGKTVGIVRREHRSVSLESVGDGVDARSARKAGRRGHLHIGVDNRHRRHKLVVGERILSTRRLVGDDGERSYFGAGTRRSRDADERRLDAHLREAVDALADVHKAHRHIIEVGLGVFIENPHDLRRVHGAAAADGDDDVGIEAGHELSAFLGASERRIRSNVREGREHDTLGRERLLDRLGIAVGVEEGVGYDERALLLHFFTEFTEREREATLLLVNLLGSAEPQHIFSSHCNRLYIDKMFNTNVLRNGVAAPAAAAESERRSELEVVNVADTALRARSINENTAGFHAGCELSYLFLLVDLIEINGARVAVAAVGNEFLGLLEGVLDILGAIHRKNGRELFVSELFGELNALDFTDKDLSVVINLKSGERGDRDGLLADDLGVKSAVDENRLAGLLEFSVAEEVAAHLAEESLNLVVDAVENDYALLRSADHTVIESLGVDDRADGESQVGRLVDNGGRVAGTDAESGSARAVSGLDHAGTTRRENKIALLHKEVRLGERRSFDPADDILRCTGFDGCVENDLGRGDRRVLRTRVGANDNAVTRLKSDKGLEDGGRSRVRRRNDSSDNADRLGNLLNTGGLVAVDYAASLDILESVVDKFAGVVVLDDLVFDNAHAGFFDSLLGERDSGTVGGE